MSKLMLASLLTWTVVVPAAHAQVQELLNDAKDAQTREANETPYPVYQDKEQFLASVRSGVRHRYGAYDNDFLREVLRLYGVENLPPYPHDCKRRAVSDGLPQALRELYLINEMQVFGLSEDNHGFTLIDHKEVFAERVNTLQKACKRVKGAEAAFEALLNDYSSALTVAFTKIKEKREAKLAETARRTTEDNKAKAEDNKAKALYVREIKAGKRPVRSVSDAALFHEAKGADAVLEQPMFKPDTIFYAGTGSLNEETLAGGYRCALGRSPFELDITKQTQTFGKGIPRVGATISFVGKYTANSKSYGLRGEPILVPVFEAVAIEVD